MFQMYGVSQGVPNSWGQLHGNSKNRNLDYCKKLALGQKRKLTILLLLLVLLPVTTLIA